MPEYPEATVKTEPKTAACGCDLNIRTVYYPLTGATVIESVSISWPCYAHGGGR
jgi:hypothetical protein